MANNGLAVMKQYLSEQTIKTRFNDVLGQKSPQFMASIINTVAGSKGLRNCDQQSVLGAAFIAASLDLPIDPNLGRAYIIPYAGRAQFQIGYKGFVELAIRTGKYKDMNSVEIYEDEILEYNPILGKLRFVEDFSSCKQREAGATDKIVGYYAFYELLTGFSKGLYMTKQQVINHAERYSQSYKKKDGPWATNFNEMAKKTVLKRLLSKWAVLSVEMQNAISEDQKVYSDIGQGEYADNMPPSDPVDELAEDVAEEFMPKPEEPVEEPKQEVEKPKKNTKKKEQKQAEPLPDEAQMDFDEFDALFDDSSLPFN